MEDINFHEPIKGTYELFKESFVNATITTWPKKTMSKKQLVTDEVRKLCEEKSKYHLQIKSLKANGHAVPQGLTHCCNQAKALSKKACRKAIDTWREKKAEEAERLTEISTRQGSGGSILKMLKLAKTFRLKTTTNLRSEDGTSLIISSSKKLLRWKTYFEKYAKIDAVVDKEAYNELIHPSTTLDAEAVEVMSRPISKAEPQYYSICILMR